MFDTSESESPSSLRSMLYIAFPLLAFGGITFESSTFALDLAQIGFSALLQSSCRVDLVLSSLNFGELDLPILLHALGHPDPPVFALGVSWSDPSLSLDTFIMGSLTSARGPMQLDVFLSISNFASLDFFVSSRSSVQMDSTILVLDASTMGLVLLLRSFGRSGSSPSLSEVAMLDFLLSVRCLTKFAFLLSVTGVSRFKFSLPVLDLLHLGPLMFLQSLAYLGFVMFPVDFAHSGFILSLRSLTWPGFSLFMNGECSLDAGSGLPVISWTHFDSSFSMRSFSRLDLASFFLDLAHVDFSSSLQSSSCLAFALSVCGLS